MRFQGTMINPNTGEEEEIDTEAFDETPDRRVKKDDEGNGILISPDHQDWEDTAPLGKFYVGTAELSDGTEIDLQSNDLPDGVDLVDETDTNSEDYDDFDEEE